MNNIIEVDHLSRFFEVKNPKNIRPGESSVPNSVLSSSQETEIRDEGRLWALKNISFDLQAGDRLGIIGKNGSGKSTLLKILARVLSQSSGTFSIRGKVVALLEIGSGFHPDLTGIENVYLNAALYGYGRRQTSQLLEAIVEFSELGSMVNSPVRTYSSGMYSRLAFSVGAHIDSELLLVDEVLAVGDEGFQKKSFDKMLALRNSGRTLVFVSHDMRSIEKVCNRVLTLSNGVQTPAQENGGLTPTSIAVSQYLGVPLDRRSILGEVEVSNGLVLEAFDYLGSDGAVEPVFRCNLRSDSTNRIAIEVRMMSSSGALLEISRSETDIESGKSEFVLRVPTHGHYLGVLRFQLLIAPFGYEPVVVETELTPVPSSINSVNRLEECVVSTLGIRQAE